MLNNILAIDIPKEWMTLGKELVNKYSAKSISEDDFDKECAYMAYNCGFNEVILQKYPPKPNILIDYGHMDTQEKRQIGDNFWKRDDVRNYINCWSKVHNHNNSTRYWLRKLHDIFKKVGDYKRAGECKARYGGGNIEA